MLVCKLTSGDVAPGRLQKEGKRTTLVSARFTKWKAPIYPSRCGRFFTPGRRRSLARELEQLVCAHFEKNQRKREEEQFQIIRLGQISEMIKRIIFGIDFSDRLFFPKSGVACTLTILGAFNTATAHKTLCDLLHPRLAHILRI